ncbi:MAG TPA: Spy/CpxP family protein refolding chaperone [Vicinamibacterales bacterium]|nr:Spy/CpxP family protein refolding chaperone [Vicinamibacterales bacterium]
MSSNTFIRRTGAAAGAVLVAAGLATGALAHSGDGQASERGPRARMERFARELDLTAEQRDQIRQVRQNHREDLEKVRDRLRTAHRAQREAMRARPVDEARIRAASQDVAAALADMAVLRARIHEQTLEVLTPEQQERAKELWAERGERRGRMGGHRHRLR